MLTFMQCSTLRHTWHSIHKYFLRASKRARGTWRDIVNGNVNGFLPELFLQRNYAHCFIGEVFRQMYEPLEIAMYYRNELWRNKPPKLRHHHEGVNRPLCYAFLEAQMQGRFPEAVTPTLPYAERLAAECDLDGAL